MVDMPELWMLLKDFALSQHGPDAMRSEVVYSISDRGIFPPGPVQMWLQGEWREINSVKYELTDEPVGKISPQAA